MALSTSDRLTLLGYEVRRNVKDVWGITHLYCVSPASWSSDVTFGGCISYFDSKANLEAYVIQVEEMRRTYASINNTVILNDYLAD